MQKAQCIHILEHHPGDDFFSSKALHISASQHQHAPSATKLGLPAILTSCSPKTFGATGNKIISQDFTGPIHS